MRYLFLIATLVLGGCVADLSPRACTAIADPVEYANCRIHGLTRNKGATP